MKSLAIWLENTDKITQNDLPVELHLNIWKLPKSPKIFEKRDFKRVIDIGMKFHNRTPFNIEKVKLCIYYPDIIKQEHFEDLIQYLVNNLESKLVSTLFNENLSLNIDTNNHFAKVINTHTDTEEFTTYILKSKKIKFTKFELGTIIKIDLPIIPSSKKIYIRFRINKDYSHIFCNITKPANSIWQSNFSKTELFDIRVNEVRDINNSLLEEISEANFGLCKFDKVHLFYICSSKDEYIFSHIPFESARLLENKKWENYINLVGIEKVPILAYHFKEKSKVKEVQIDQNIIKYLFKIKATEKKEFLINDFNTLIQTKYDKNNKITIIIYLIILLIITIIFNLLSNYLWEILCSVN